MTRYTPPSPKPQPDKIEGLRQMWLKVDLSDPRLNSVGRVLAIAARLDIDRFRQACRELEGESDGPGR